MRFCWRDAAAQCFAGPPRSASRNCLTQHPQRASANQRRLWEGTSIKGNPSAEQKDGHVTLCVPIGGGEGWLWRPIDCLMLRDSATGNTKAGRTGKEWNSLSPCSSFRQDRKQEEGRNTFCGILSQVFSMWHAYNIFKIYLIYRIQLM